MTIVGHRELVSILERGLPPVALLAGPASVGKWTVAWHLAEHHNIARIDRLTHNDPLTVDLVRTVIAWAQHAPFQSAFKLAVLGLDGASPAALNALLKILEEPPATMRFILTASAPTLPTVASRAQVFRFGLLRDEELADVLVAQGTSPAIARKVAPLGRGQVEQALHAQALMPARTAALAVVRAVATGDAELFDQAFKNFDDNAGLLLRTWLEEAITGQWRWFTAADSHGLAGIRLRQMLIALSQFNTARARIGVRAALEQFLPD